VGHLGAVTNDDRPGPLDRLLTPVDAVVQQVINHIDLNAILEKVDVNELIERVDLDAVVERSVRQATRRTLDSARSEGARLDHWITQLVDRALRRPPGWRPERPTSTPTKS
jgi:hypothetical protein